MVLTVTQRTVVEAIQELRPFSLSTGNLKGYLFEIDGAWEFQVFSYAEMIGRVFIGARNPTTGSRDKYTWITDKKFSVTTSKHTGFVRRGFANLRIL